MKTKLFYLIFVLFSSLSYCNNVILFIEILNTADVPKVVSVQKNRIVLQHQRTDITNIFSKYEISKFEKAFPSSKKPKLQNVYLLECNSPRLKNELSVFTDYFYNIEETQAPKLLYDTNDYYITGDYYNSKNYDLVNVKGAWEYSKGHSDFYVGVSEGGVKLDHEDLIGKALSMYNIPLNETGHATSTAGIIGANTNNNLGMSGIGFQSKMISLDFSFNDMLILSQNGVRIINCSWGAASSSVSYIQDIIDEIYENGTVIIASAGNGIASGSNNTEYYYPASYNHVISVSSVGSQDIGWIAPVGSAAGKFANWRDHVESWIGYPSTTHQINDKVDILAPGFGCFTTAFNPNAPSTNLYAAYGGTSSAAPHVSGIASLIFTANNCLSVDELESIIKLTAVSVDSISANAPYIGGLGAGRINAEKATKIAWQMNSANGGEVLVNNRTFKKWDFKLVNSPEYIRIKNQRFIENSGVIFRAKKGITLDSNTLLEPGLGKTHFLYVDNVNTCFGSNTISRPTIIITTEKNNISNSVTKADEIVLYPNPASDYLSIKSKNKILKSEIYDVSGKQVKTFNNEQTIRIHDLPAGTYIIKIYDLKKTAKSIKFVRK
ncbi:S8 family peptidase [Chryseobacterium suipulveris]|uniref:S8 family peptidase n=1 Tax=Chryseobacterium suipulveris TaxID=2929800 RepID=A0ABY4BNY9_9FLAO|nr:S8 family peptidase [Chryseobacterium suipulveris]UOE40909.1 S8 family peptidase [Chryseobacterium suipulveris]